MGNPKIPHKSYTHVNFRNITLSGLIKGIYHQFYFGDITNGRSKIDTTKNISSTYGNGYISMILTNLSQREKVSPEDIRKVLSSPKQSTTHQLKELTIKKNCIIRLTLHLTVKKKHDRFHMELTCFS